jgi:hypothetical protein
MARFRLLKKLNSQLSLELGSRYLGDHAAGLCDLNNATQGELTRYENNYKALNLITIALGRNMYDRVTHIEIAHDV